MKIIILGIGRVGELLVKNLSKEGHDVVVVDKDSFVVNDIVNRYDIIGFNGSGIEREVLAQSDVPNADVFIACTQKDEVNILACVLAKKLGAKRLIARVRAPELYSEMPNISKELGIDFAFNPEIHTASEIFQVLKYPSAINVEGFAGGKAIMPEFYIGANNPLIGKTLSEISSYGFKMLFAVVHRGKDVIIPKGDFKIQEGDCVRLIASESEITAFSKKLKIFKPRVKSVFIVGGSTSAYYLAKQLASARVDVKLVEKDKERCNVFSEEIANITVLHADGTDQNVLEEENLKGAEAVVSLTGADESNVIISLYAKHKGVNKVITKLDKPNIIEMAPLLGLDTIVEPKIAIASHVLRFIRACQTDSQNGMKSLYKISDEVEAVEFTVSEDFIGKDTPLKQLKISKNILIGGIVRGDEFILPSGDTTIMVGDRVIVVAKAKQVNELSEIFR